MDLTQFLIKRLQTLRDVEMETAKELPYGIAKAQDNELRGFLETHAAACWDHVTRLDAICGEFGCSCFGEPSRVVRALVQEMIPTVETVAPSPFTDCSIASSAKAGIHLAIAEYEIAAEISDRMSMTAVYNLLTMSLAEEKNADDSLTTILSGPVIQAALDQPLDSSYYY